MFYGAFERYDIDLQYPHRNLGSAVALGRTGARRKRRFIYLREWLWMAFRSRLLLALLSHFSRTSVACTLGVSHKSSLQSPSRAFRSFFHDAPASTASQIGARGKMRELESTAASRARGFPVLAAPLHNARPGAPRVAAIPSLVLAQQMRAAQQGQHQRCTACTAKPIITGRARACGIASSMCIQTLCDVEE